MPATEFSAETATCLNIFEAVCIYLIFAFTAVPQPRTVLSSRRILPLMTSRKLARLPPNGQPKQAWVESLGEIEDDKLGIVDLHPEIFGTFPRWVFDDISLRYTCT